MIGDDPDIPCWKYVLDGGFDNTPDLKKAFEEFASEIKGFRVEKIYPDIRIEEETKILELL